MTSATDAYKPFYIGQHIGTKMWMGTALIKEKKEHRWLAEKDRHLATMFPTIARLEHIRNNHYSQTPTFRIEVFQVTIKSTTAPIEIVSLGILDKIS